MSYTAMAMGVDSSCHIYGDEDPNLRAGGLAVWNALKPCLRKGEEYGAPNGVDKVWACNSSPWKSVTESVLEHLYALCPRGRIPMTGILHNYPTPDGTLGVHSGLARQVWKLSQSQGYMIQWWTIVNLVKRFTKIP